MAFPAGMGARVGNPENPVVVIHGDGGFQFNMQELGTAIQYDIPLTLLLFNDNAWGVLYQYQDKLQGGRHFATKLANPDFMKLADAYGVRGTRVSNLGALSEELAASTRSGQFRIIEIETPNGFDNFE